MNNAFESIKSELNKAIKHETKQASVANIHQPPTNEKKELDQDRNKSQH